MVKGKAVWIVIAAAACMIAFAAGLAVERYLISGGGGGADELSEVQKKMILYQAALSTASDNKSITTDLLKGLEEDNLTSNVLQKKYERALKSKPRRRQEEDPNKIYDVKIGKSYVKGPKDAPITIAEFSEFQCPYCGRAQATMKKIEQTYPGKIRHVFKAKILEKHTKAKLAHNASLAAGEQGMFWEMLELIFADQRKMGEEAYLKYAGQLGLNVEKFKADMHSDKYKDFLAEEGAQARSLGVRGTPTFFVNGRKIRGAKPFETFQKLIDEELAKKNKK